MRKLQESYDVIVAGAGIAGLATAFALASMKQKVLVVSKKKSWGASTPAAGGILDPLLEMKQDSFFLPFCMRAFKNWARDLQRVEYKAGIRAGYLPCGMIYGALSQEDEEILRDRFIWQKKINIKMQWLNRAEILKNYPMITPQVRAGLLYPEIGRVQPAKLAYALKRAAEKTGVDFLFTDEQLKLSMDGTVVSGIQAGERAIRSASVVNATGSWAGTQQKMGARLPIKPVRGQILIVERKLPIKAILHTVDGGYIVPWDQRSLLLGSTVEHVGFKSVVTQAGRIKIRRKNQHLVPSLASCREIDSWAGLRPFPKDRYPLIGASKIPGLYIAAGYYRSGILIGFYAGQLLAQGIVSGKMPPELTCLSPKRFNV